MSAIDVQPGAHDELVAEAADAGTGTGLLAVPVRKPRRIGVIIALVWVAFVLFCAVTADFLPIHDYESNITPVSEPPFHSWPEFLGTDQLGRSVVSRLVYGSRVSLAAGLISATIGISIGVALGIFAASNRRADEVIGTITDAALAFPGIVLLLALSAAMRPGLVPLIIGLTIFSIPPFTRLARANAKVVMNREFVQAARLLGAKRLRILVREVLPNVLRPVLAYAPLVVAALIVAEATVSFLGLGVPAPTPTWGGMIAQGQPQLSNESYQVLVPATVLFLTVFSINVLGRWLRSKTADADAKI
ncbi:MAG: ABC transporter permease [Acidimicrobiia bacterium]